MSIAPPRLLDPLRFDGTVDGKAVALYQLRNSRGMVASITNYGAKLEQLLVPGRHGEIADLVLGYDNLKSAIAGSPSMGAFIGRYAGRIENASFTLNGENFRLSANNGPHCLHGGKLGSRFQVFDGVQRNESSVEMSYVFADGEEGFPGTLLLKLMYSLTDDNELVLDHEALALDKSTVASFTPHPFFNLDGEGNGSILNHEVQINADRYFEMTPDVIASGRLLPVAGTPFDFREPVRLGKRVKAQVAGYDDCYVINRSDGPEGSLAFCARVSSIQSDRVMEVFSTEPAMQFFIGMNGNERMAGGPGKSGQTYFQQHGLCMEPQGYPNAPNRPQFPSSVHEPGKSRSGKTIYRFKSLHD